MSCARQEKILNLEVELNIGTTDLVWFGCIIRIVSIVSIEIIQFWNFRIFKHMWFNQKQRPHKARKCSFEKIQHIGSKSYITFQERDVYRKIYALHCRTRAASYSLYDLDFSWLAFAKWCCLRSKGIITSHWRPYKKQSKQRSCYSRFLKRRAPAKVRIRLHITAVQVALECLRAFQASLHQWHQEKQPWNSPKKYFFLGNEQFRGISQN